MVRLIDSQSNMSSAVRKGLAVILVSIETYYSPSLLLTYKKVCDCEFEK
jgi:hypothetical protein